MIADRLVGAALKEHRLLAGEKRERGGDRLLSKSSKVYFQVIADVTWSRKRSLVTSSGVRDDWQSREDKIMDALFQQLSRQHLHISSLFLCLLNTIDIAEAQIQPDATLPNNTQIDTPRHKCTGILVVALARDKSTR